MNISESFLIVWAVLATGAAVYYQIRAARATQKYEGSSNLLCDVVVGDVKPRKNAEGFWVVENHNTRIVFKRMEREL